MNARCRVSPSALLVVVAVATGSAAQSNDAADCARSATHIFAIGCSLPAHAASSGKADNWTDVPEDQGYAAIRDVIKRHVEHLIDQLQKR